MPRLFVAIDLPEDIRDSLADLYLAIPGARWVNSDQLHLTLRFIGDVDELAFNRVMDNLRGVIFKPFLISLYGVGYFPPRRKPNVLWAGIKESPELLRLQAAIERAIVKSGCEPDHRNFHAHVTLARLRDDAPLGRITDFLAVNALFSAPGIEVTEFHLYSSTLNAEGATHHIEASYHVA
ncbi:MAG: RNA 2',3'-cyclic phosphodiesterase [Chitinivibrionales bacterium]|nr:RNA 2',3'-cyclic phosphodiesterase [Chitinivibrionales bacterium]